MKKIKHLYLFHGNNRGMEMITAIMQFYPLTLVLLAYERPSEERRPGAPRNRLPAG